MAAQLIKKLEDVYRTFKHVLVVLLPSRVKANYSFAMNLVISLKLLLRVQSFLKVVGIVKCLQVFHHQLNFVMIAL